MANKRSNPFHIMLGRAPVEGERRTYEVITTKEEACSSTNAADALISRFLKEERIEIKEGDHLVVAQITRVRALKPILTISQVDEDPNDAFGGGEASAPAEPIRAAYSSIKEAQAPAESEPIPEVNSRVELPDDPPEAPASEDSTKTQGVPAAVTPPPGDQTTDDENTLVEDDPLSDMEPKVDDIVDDSIGDPPPADTKEEAPIVEKAERRTSDQSKSDDPLDDIF